MKSTAGAQQRRPTAAKVAPGNPAPRPARKAARPLRHLPAARPSAPQASMASQRLKLALSISALIHAIALAVHFSFPVDERLAKDKPLEVVLVNSKTRERPQDAQALAQANLDGGGNTDEDRRAKTPLPVSRQQKEGSQLESAQQRVRELEARQRMLIAQTRAPVKTVSQPTAREAQPDKPPEVSGLDLASSAMAMARLQAQIERQYDEYNKRPRKNHVAVRTQSYVSAQWIEEWRQKVEKVGTLNYPNEAKGKFYGNLVMTVTITADGSIKEVEIDRSSGHKILDNAARRIVQMAGPYSPFSAEMAREFDEFVITRTWHFTRDEIQTSNR